MTGSRRITLVGPIAQPGQPAVGGYESANLRLMSLLKLICADTRTLAYPRTSGSRIDKATQYARGFAAQLWKLLGESGRDAAVHFTPLCRHFLGAELLLALAARTRGNRLTLDLRAGMQESWYRRSSIFYRVGFRCLVSLATAIAYEGEAYARWLDSLAPSATRFWLPNFVPRDMAVNRPRCPLPDAPTVIFVGTVSEAKGVTASLRVFRSLRQHLPAARFVVVGRCDTAFRQAQEHAGLVGQNVEFTGPLPPAAVETHLDRAHFFLFLSHWFGEGHSNALTEAMARGCVPLASRHGFSASVVGCADLIVDDTNDSETIAARIMSIWQSGGWYKLSDRMVQRVQENFTEDRVLLTLQAIYLDTKEAVAGAPAPEPEYSRL